LRDALWHNRNAENESAVAGLLELETVKTVYLHGSKLPELISSDNWNMDFFTTIQRPHGREISLDLFYDYRTNVALYPEWQSFLKARQPDTLIFWGQDDIFFTREVERLTCRFAKGGDAPVGRRALRGGGLLGLYLR
jgi:hypothetical protein